MKVNANAKRAEIALTVIRADGTRVELGTVSYHHRNPLKRLWWALVGKPAADRRIKQFNEVK